MAIFFSFIDFLPLLQRTLIMSRGCFKTLKCWSFVASRIETLLMRKGFDQSRGWVESRIPMSNEKIKSFISRVEHSKVERSRDDNRNFRAFYVFPKEALVGEYFPADVPHPGTFWSSFGIG